MSHVGVVAPSYLPPELVRRVSFTKCGRFPVRIAEKSPIVSRKNLCRRVSCSNAASPPAAPAAIASIKEFLDDLKQAGRVRIIVNTGAGVLESVTRLDKLFYSDVPGKGEYANVMNKEDNVDFHLRVGEVASAKLIQGKSMRGDIPTYMIRLFDETEFNVASLLVMWKPETSGEYDEGQVEAFHSLLSKYGDQISFS